MKQLSKPIQPCLWFDHHAEDAALFYTSIFPNSKIESISRYGKEGFEFHGKPEGSVLTVSFTINGQPYTALNGSPEFIFNEAISLQVFCDNQEEIDFYWEKLCEGGEESMCGWLKDKYGLSWQIVPSILPELMSNPEKSGKVTLAFLQMKKFDLATLLKV
ncbi:MAG: VOC family protein [Prolixibacteraceae bacterium]